MKKRWIAITVSLVALVGGATGFAASTAAQKDTPPVAQLIGANMARAEVITVIRGAVHDYRIDQGRILAVRPGAVDLLERDGTKQTIPVAPDVVVETLGGGLLTAADLRPRMLAQTIRDGDAPAGRIKVLARTAR